MSTTPQLDMQKKENWGSKLGVVLAVAGSAVGLGNFLRFPGTAVNNGGGAFMIPYIISFLILGIPIAWCEWTIGRLGGRYGQNNGPGIMYALWRRAPSKGIGTLTLIIPLCVYMYYVFIEAVCLRYAIEFFQQGFDERFKTAIAASPGTEEISTVVGSAGGFMEKMFGMGANGDVFSGSMLWFVLVCFLANFFIIYRGVTKGIESFCKIAMPLLVACAVVILIRVLTLDAVVDDRTIGHGLGFMWNPQWEKLLEPEVWLRAAGQIFFSLSVGFGLILCYSSYLRPNDDVVLSSLSASSTNEFCEVVLGGMIVVPTAFLFLGPENATGTTFTLGFVTMPAIMHFMPFGSFFGGMWFGLLFLAAVTSSISMLQPAIAFLEDGFGMKRRASVLILALFTTCGSGLIMYFSHNLTALDFADFWCEFMMIVAALGQVLIFGWVVGAGRGIKEANRGADFQIPPFMVFVLKYVTPTFLITVLGMLGVTALKEWFDNERSRRAHQRIIKAKAIDQVPTIIDEMNSMAVRYKAAADSGDSERHSQDIAAYVEIFQRSVVVIEALEPSQIVIDDLYKANRLVIGLETRWVAKDMDELHKLTVALKKHQMELNETI
ncbi:MAG: sodium-dependent transporter, partial [Planctomycetes bacterium]|nr:sodium-dependent transporter [Planctomycetota bacterium]